MGVSAQLEQGGGGEHAADLRQAEGGRLPVFVFFFSCSHAPAWPSQSRRFIKCTWT